MTIVEFIAALFYEVDEQLRTMPKHPEAHLWPKSECMRFVHLIIGTCRDVRLRADVSVPMLCTLI